MRIAPRCEQKVVRVYAGLYLSLLALILSVSVMSVPLAQAQTPVISRVLADSSQLARPTALDVYLAHLSFDYSDNEADITALSVTTVSPDKTQETQMIDAGALGITGKQGQARYQVAYQATSPLGTYTYVLQLVDAKNYLSRPTSVAVALATGLEPPLTVTEVSPRTGQPGDEITLRGTGFDLSALDANAVSIAGVSAEVIDMVPDGIVFKVPGGAVRGRVSVANRRGLVFSPVDFLVQPALSIAGSGQKILAPLQETRFTATVSGLTNQEVVWHVQGILGGTPTLGTIDQHGVYTAPAVPPDAGMVGISAVSIADKALQATTHVTVAYPLPLVGGGIVRATTGGTVQSEDGLVTLYVPPGALSHDLKVEALSAAYVPSNKGLTGLSSEMLAVGKIALEVANPTALLGIASLQLLLPMWTSQETQYAMMKREGDRFVDSQQAYHVHEDGHSISATIADLQGELSEFVVARIGPPAPPETLPPPAVTGVRQPVSIIEEGLTLPVLIEGANFWPEYTRVGAADPALTQHLTFGTVVVGTGGTQLGFTLRIHPIPTLGRGQQLPVAFRIERLTATGAVGGSMVTNANDFVINGLPELIVSPDPSSNLFTIDGQHIDQAISASDRYSTLVVAEGAVLGIGSAVSQVSADGFGWDLSTVNAFESAFGRLDWVTDAQRTSNSLLFFQPENRLVWLEVTGPVRIDGTVHMAGMHGGENPRLDHPSGPGQARLGGITSDTLSGGVGGAGGVTQGGTTHDGQRAGGNNTPDLGVGRGANGTLLLTQQPAGFGSRFDPVNESLNDFIEDAVEVVSSLVSIATGATALAAGSPGGLIDIATGVAGFISVVSELPTTDSLASGQVVAGQGGHGGLRPSGIGPDLEDDFQVLPGGGGGGGGGGGSSYYEETFFSIPLDTSKEIGGGGAGGGGAAGALRITTASALEIGPNGTINGSGGRGGFGEPHRWLGSPSGGGGGGAGGVAKLQGSRLLNRGIIDLSGGARSGAIIAQGDLPVPVGRYGDGRVQILDGPQKGGFLYYGSDNIGVHPPTVHMAWPTGRLRASITLPFTGIRGVGTAEHIPFLFIGALRGLLVITDDRRLVLMSVPDYFSGTPQIAYLAELADLQQISALAGFTPTDAAQSPVPPQHIFVSGMRTVNGAVQSQIHEFDAGGNYLGLAFSTTTSGYVDFVGHLQEIDFLSDGRLAALMATAPTINASGIHVIDLVAGTASLLIPGEDNLVSMSVLRGGQGELFYAVIDDRTYACDGVCPVPTAIKRYDTSGQEVDLLALVTETVSSPGEPGLLRLDGSLPASRAPRLQFDGFDLPDLRYPVGSNTEATFNSPAIGSLEAPAGSATGMENLVIGRIFGDQVTLFCQGGEEGESAVVFKNGLPVTLTPPADSSGQFEVPLQLDLGFNTVWVETNRGGDTHELLKRHILLIRTPLFPYR